MLEKTHNMYLGGWQNMMGFSLTKGVYEYTPYFDSRKKIVSDIH